MVFRVFYLFPLLYIVLMFTHCNSIFERSFMKNPYFLHIESLVNKPVQRVYWYSPSFQCYDPNLIRWNSGSEASYVFCVFWSYKVTLIQWCYIFKNIGLLLTMERALTKNKQYEIGKYAINITWYPSTISIKVNPLRDDMLNIWNCTLGEILSLYV